MILHARNYPGSNHKKERRHSNNVITVADLRLCIDKNIKFDSMFGKMHADFLGGLPHIHEDEFDFFFLKVCYILFNFRQGLAAVRTPRRPKKNDSAFAVTEFVKADFLTGQ